MGNNKSNVREGDHLVAQCTTIQPIVVVEVVVVVVVVVAVIIIIIIIIITPWSRVLQKLTG